MPAHPTSGRRPANASSRGATPDATRLLAEDHREVHALFEQYRKLAEGGGQESTYREVKSGDTLSKIAKEAYGDATAYMKIFEANKPMLKDPDKIYPGQQLRIPA